MSVSTEHDEGVKYDGRCMSISRHWISLHVLQLLLSLRSFVDQDAIRDATQIGRQVGEYVALRATSLVVLGRCWIRFTLINIFKGDARLSRKQAFLRIALPHIVEVFVKATVLVEEYRGALQLDCSRAVFFATSLKLAELDAEGVEFVEVHRLWASLRLRSRECA